jgi:hypothetical protein
MRKQCKCHGVSGACTTKTCWKTVPPMDEYATLLKRKYAKAQQVSESSAWREQPQYGLRYRKGRRVQCEPENGKAALYFSVSST